MCPHRDSLPEIYECCTEKGLSRLTLYEVSGDAPNSTRVGLLRGSMPMLQSGLVDEFNSPSLPATVMCLPRVSCPIARSALLALTKTGEGSNSTEPVVSPGEVS